MLKRLLSCVREYRRPAILAPIYVTMEVILVNQAGKTLELTLRDLLPYSFDNSYLE